MKHTLVLAILLPCLASAADIETYGFNLRYPLALSHFSPYGEVAANGGSGAASAWSSSPNPAALSLNFREPVAGIGDLDGAFSVQFSDLIFSQGQQIRFLSESALFDAGRTGVFRFSFVSADSNHELIRDLPVAFDYGLTGGRIDWGMKIDDTLRFGFGGGYSQSDIAFQIPGLDVLRTDRETWGLRTGVMVTPTESKRWLIGLSADYSQGRNDTLSQLPTPLGLVTSRTQETIHQFYFRPGIAFALDKDRVSWAHLDYEYARFASNSEVLKSHRVLLGGEYHVAMPLHLRAGVMLDDRSNAGWSVGAGIHFGPKVHLDLAYQNGMFPEVREEFGHSQTVNISFTIQWGGGH